MTLAAFLNSLATGLAAMSPSAELLSAFSAFDDDDSGQVDLAELRDALLQTAPEPGERTLTAAEVERIMAGFSGRRAFSKSMNNGLSKRGEVFKYQEFVNSIMGGSGSSEVSSLRFGHSDQAYCHTHFSTSPCPPPLVRIPLGPELVAGFAACYGHC